MTGKVADGLSTNYKTVAEESKAIGKDALKRKANTSVTLNQVSRRSFRRR